MTKQRPNLGFGDELDSFNPSEWQPKPARKAPPEAAREAASASGFKSREAKPAVAPQSTPKTQQRRRRTGRSAQFNLKAKPETIEAFCTVADAQGWGLGETLEYAVELLKKEYGGTG